MKRILFLFILLALISFQTQGQFFASYKGKIENSNYTTISLKSYGDPITGTKELFSSPILEGGNFEVKANVYGPQIFNVIIDGRMSGIVYLRPESIIIHEWDEKDRSKYKFEGDTKDYIDWFYKPFTKIDYKSPLALGFDSSSFDIYLEYNLNVRDKKIKILDSIYQNKPFNSLDYSWMKYRIEYRIFPILFGNANELFQSPLDGNYDFYELLDLNNNEASKISNPYNFAVETYIMHQYRKERAKKGLGTDGKDDEYANTFYNLAYKLLAGEVRNVILTRHACSLLSNGDDNAESIYERYLEDCDSENLIVTTKEVFQRYIEIKNRKLGPRMNIQSQSFPLFEKFTAYKGKVIYLDFWASWCSPCIASIPYTKKIKKQFENDEFLLIYVGIDDQMSRLEQAAKKYEMEGEHILLNQEESQKAKELFEIEEIPTYVLIDRNGDVISNKELHPQNEDVIIEIEKLLNKK